MNNQKARLAYEAPEFNVIRLASEDIITTSPSEAYYLPEIGLDGND